MRSPEDPDLRPFNLRRRFALTSLGMVLLMALGLGWLMSSLLTERMMRREGEVTLDFVQNLLHTDQSARYFVEPQDADLRRRFLASMAHVSSMREPVRANAYRPDGTVLWSTDQALIGQRFPVNDELDDALKGELVVHFGRIGGSEPAKQEHQGLTLRSPYFVESYIPVTDPRTHEVLGVMEFYKVPEQLNTAIREGVYRLWLACALGALLLFSGLYWIVARADRMLRAQQRQLAQGQALTAAVDLAGAVAHNLRNPLASIRASAEMLEGASVHDHDTAEHCQDITAAVDRADRWITELVRVSQGSQLQRESVAIAPLVRDCLEEMGPEMLRHGIAWRVPEIDPGPVSAHAAMLRQIVLSVIANAIDAMPQGGDLDVGLLREDGQIRLRIADSGHGVSELAQQRVFRPFFSTKSGGLGIGLALAQRMITHWGGEVTLAANAPRGARVEITLPAARPAVRRT